MNGGVGFVNEEIGNLFGVKIQNERSKSADGKTELESVADKSVNPIPFLAAVVNGEHRLHAVADGGDGGVLDQQEIIDDGEGNHAVEADIFDQRDVKQHQDHADGTFGNEFGHAVVAGAHQAAPAFEFEREFEDTAGIKIMAEQKEGRKEFGKRSGIGRAFHPPAQEADEQPIQKDVAKNKKNQSGGDKGGASLQADEVADGEVYAVEEGEKDDVKVIIAGHLHNLWRGAKVNQNFFFKEKGKDGKADVGRRYADNGFGKDVIGHFIFFGAELFADADSGAHDQHNVKPPQKVQNRHNDIDGGKAVGADIFSHKPAVDNGNRGCKQH